VGAGEFDRVMVEHSKYCIFNEIPLGGDISSQPAAPVGHAELDGPVFVACVQLKDPKSPVVAREFFCQGCITQPSRQGAGLGVRYHAVELCH
jgi:hypothetical protein